jgi:hypothetical protein
MVDGLHIPIWNRTKKLFAIALSGADRCLRGRDDGDNVTNVKYKSNHNCGCESPLHNEYIIIKINSKKQSWTWWHTSAVPQTWEVEVGRS